ncbi:hypothetical protein ADL00_17005 [Streptomyces sp. AS58]|uniref:Uncharacterized protein n=1 Tax=Streptomyces cadmiisoli TaxID=2184053 RepID=A0A2Z4IUY7_9ACTN|nr:MULTISPECIES: putative glycolipid-binding domain-containing protein [Streptomyces]AWW36675.1 hypothetical protein DN051_08600 [Streptomyces cadmiisoli]KOV66529.1 hypothetical protein ADL00_17005 [Streptomyces sp. AS58]
MTTSRALTWNVTAAHGYETAWVDCDGGTLRARGRAVGTTPAPYWISYELETGEDRVTRRLRVIAETSDHTRSLDLRHDGHGTWTADGAPVPQVDGALDCDLALCPLTNTMPVLRHGLHRSGGTRSFLMAWVSVPDLAVRPSPQTYTYLAPTDGGSRVGFASGDFRSELEFDTEGFVVDYPGLATRLTPR